MDPVGNATEVCMMPGMPLMDRRPRTPPIAFRVSLGRINPGKFPTALDYFEITPRNAEKDYTYKRDMVIHAALAELGYGDNPTRVPIRLLTDEMDDWLKQDYGIADQQGRRRCTGDGVSALRGLPGNQRSIPCHYSRDQFPPRPPVALLPILTKPETDDPSSPNQCAFAQNRNLKAGFVCKPLTEFLFFLDIPQVGYTKGAIARFHSKAERTADELPGSIIASAAHTGGVLQGLPFDLVVQMRQMQFLDPESGKLSQTRKPVVHVAPRLDDSELLEAARTVVRQRAALKGEIEESRKLLAAARMDRDDAAVEREFGVVEVNGEIES